MHDYPVIIFAALVLLLFGLFSKLSEKSMITGPYGFYFRGYTHEFFYW